MYVEMMILQREYIASLCIVFKWNVTISRVLGRSLCTMSHTKNFQSKEMGAGSQVPIFKLISYIKDLFRFRVQNPFCQCIVRFEDSNRFYGFCISSLLMWRREKETSTTAQQKTYNFGY